MFNFFYKKSNDSADFRNIAVDMHSHLIPAVDDGVQTPEQSYQLITGLQELGFSHLFTTPHSMKDMYPNSLESLETGFNKIKKVIPAGMGMDYSSEYFLDQLFSENLAAGTLRTLPGNRLLVEFSMISRTADLEQHLFNIQLKEYQVVLAHPERYLFFHRDLKSYASLKDMGIEFQINALSLMGYYGKNIRTIAEKLISEKMIDFIGTDIHHQNHLEALRKVPNSRAFQELLKSGVLKNELLLL